MEHTIQLVFNIVIDIADDEEKNIFEIMDELDSTITHEEIKIKSTELIEYNI